MKTMFKALMLIPILVSLTSCKSTVKAVVGAKAAAFTSTLTVNPSILTAVGQQVALEVTANETITKVEFYRVISTGSTPVTSLVYPDTTAPFKLTFAFSSSAQNGTYTYFTKTYDSSNTAYTSKQMSYQVAINCTSNCVTPTISATATPAALSAAGNVTISTTVTNTSKAEFYRVVGNTESLIYTDIYTPFQLPFTFSQASQNGTYNYKAKAFSSSGSTASATVSFTVGIPNASFGQNLPPAGAKPSAGYAVWTPDLSYDGTMYDGKPYKTCSSEQHDKYWAIGKKDGKVYATWHPPFEVDAQDNIICYYGHEHGLDPRQYANYSHLVDMYGGVLFGMVNEEYATFIKDTTLERREDHVGHKVEYINGFKAAYGNPAGVNGRPIDDLYDAGFTCNFLMKVHMGTHSDDAFTNHLHELWQDMKCTDGTEYTFAFFKPFGVGGFFGGTDPNDTSKQIATGLAVSPPGSSHVGRPGSTDHSTGGGSERAIPDAINTWAGNLFPMTDIWSANHNFNFGNNRSMGTGPYIAVFNPARFFDKSHVVGATDHMQLKSIDACYEVKNGATVRRGDTVCASAAPATKVNWDDPNSPFNGTWRNMNFKATNIYNSGGASTYYISYFGQTISTTPFAGSIEMYVAPINNGWGYGSSCSSLNIGDTVPAGVTISKSCKVDANRKVLQKDITGSLLNAVPVAGDTNGLHRGLGFTREYVVNHNFYPPVFGIPVKGYPTWPLNRDYVEWNKVDALNATRTVKHRLAGVRGIN